MALQLHSRFALGVENPRESRRFRHPIYVTDETRFPWRGLFEDRDLALTVVARMNEWDSMVSELRTLRKRLLAYTTAPENEAEA